MGRFNGSGPFSFKHFGAASNWLFLNMYMAYNQYDIVYRKKNIKKYALGVIY